MNESRRGFIQSLILLAGAGAASSGLTGVVTAADSATSGKRASEMTPDKLREQLVTCLGGPWPEPCPLQPMLRETIQKDGYRIESLTYEVEPGDRVPALLLIPDGVSVGVVHLLEVIQVDHADRHLPLGSAQRLREESLELLLHPEPVPDAGEWIA